MQTVDNQQSFNSSDQLKALLIKIHLMKSYATEQGTAVPPETAEEIARLGALTERHSPVEGTAASVTEATGGDLHSITAEATKEAIPLAFAVYSRLAKLIAPVTPQSIEASQPRKGWRRLKQPRVSDVLIFITIIAVTLFFGSAGWASRAPNGAPPTGLALQLSYLGAALLGASFSGLFTAYKYISTRTFDPGQTSSYVTRVLLGTVSGLILANFGESLMGGGGDSKLKVVLAPAALALIGGYSADAVNLILQRVADTLVAAVRGSDEAIKAADLQQRQKTVGELGDLLAKTTDPDTKSAIQRMMTALGAGKDVSGAVGGK